MRGSTTNKQQLKRQRRQRRTYGIFWVKCLTLTHLFYHFTNTSNRFEFVCDWRTETVLHKIRRADTRLAKNSKMMTKFFFYFFKTLLTWMSREWTREKLFTKWYHLWVYLWQSIDQNSKQEETLAQLTSLLMEFIASIDSIDWKVLKDEQ